MWLGQFLPTAKLYATTTGFYVFPSQGIIQLGYARLGLFSYRWDGELLEREEWQEARLTEGDYATVMMAVEFALKNGLNKIDQELSRRLYGSLDRISGKIPAADVKRKALLRKLQGQCAELKGDLPAAIAAYDAALDIDRKIGIKRRAEQIRKQLKAE